MKQTSLVGILTVPILLYALGVVLLVGPPFGWVGVVSLASTALPLAALATDRLGPWAYLPAAGALLALVAGLGTAPGAAATGALFVGVLAGAPLGWLGIGLRLRAAPASALAVAFVSLLLAFFEVAVVRGIPLGTGAATTAWIDSARNVLVGQATSLADLGRGAAVPPAPLSDVRDPTLAIVALLPVLGLLASWLTRSEDPSDAPALEPAGREIESRYPERAPLASPWSLGVAAGAVLAVEAAAIEATAAAAVLGLTLAVAATLLALIVLIRRRSATGGPADAVRGIRSVRRYDGRAAESSSPGPGGRRGGNGEGAPGGSFTGGAGPTRFEPASEAREASILDH